MKMSTCFENGSIAEKQHADNPCRLFTKKKAGCILHEDPQKTDQARKEAIIRADRRYQYQRSIRSPVE
jgi:hypothetical protein